MSKSPTKESVLSFDDAWGFIQALVEYSNPESNREAPTLPGYFTDKQHAFLASHDGKINIRIWSRSFVRTITLIKDAVRSERVTASHRVACNKMLKSLAIWLE